MFNSSTARLTTIASTENYFRTKSHNDSQWSCFLLQSANILASKGRSFLQHALQFLSLLEPKWVHLREHGIDPFGEMRESAPASHPDRGLGCSWDISPDIHTLSLPQRRPMRKQRMEEKGKSRKLIVEYRAGGTKEQGINMQYEDTEPKSKENWLQYFFSQVEAAAGLRKEPPLGERYYFKLPSCSCPFIVTHTVLQPLSFKAQFCARTLIENIWRPVHTYWQHVHLGSYRNWGLGETEASQTIQKNKQEKKKIKLKSQVC